MQRKRPLRRKTKLAPGQKRLAKSNPAQTAKRRQRQRTKHAAYRASETYRLVEARAGGRCEWWEDATDTWGAFPRRCTETTGLQHHHRTYQRYGGDELPEDIQVLCTAHHALVETRDYPHRRRGAA